MKATNQIAIQKILEQLEGLESELERIQNEEKDKDNELKYQCHS